MDISKIDKNFKSKDTANNGNVINVPSKYVTLYGLSYDKELGFVRLPHKITHKVSFNLDYLGRYTAGGRIAFSTNSSFLKLNVKYNSLDKMGHMTIYGQGGFALLEVKNKKERLVANYIPLFTDSKGFSQSKDIYKDHKFHTYILYFPLYNQVESLSLEIEPGCNISPIDIYKKVKPILYYGSSITEGGCSTRPDTSYQAMISKFINIDHINLGFSGNGFGEQIICDYLSSIDCSIFVMDYDHNAPNVEHLKKTHKNMYLTFRKKHPATPIIMLSAPNYHNNPKVFTERKKVILKTYEYAIKNGDKDIYFIDGSKIYPSNIREMCTVDGCHPNDLGFYFFAKKIVKVIKDNKLIFC